VPWTAPFRPGGVSRGRRHSNRGEVDAPLARVGLLLIHPSTRAAESSGCAHVALSPRALCPLAHTESRDLAGIPIAIESSTQREPDVAPGSRQGCLDCAAHGCRATRTRQTRRPCDLPAASVGLRNEPVIRASRRVASKQRLRCGVSSGREIVAARSRRHSSVAACCLSAIQACVSKPELLASPHRAPLAAAAVLDVAGGGVRGDRINVSRAWRASSPSAAHARAAVAQWRRRRAFRRGRTLFDEHVTAAKEYRAGAAPRLAHSATEISQVLIRVDDVTLRGLPRHVIISTVVEGEPEPPEPLGTGHLWPPQGGVSRHQARSTRAFANSSSHPPGSGRRVFGRRVGSLARSNYSIRRWTTVTYSPGLPLPVSAAAHPFGWRPR